MIALTVTERSQIAEARRLAVDLARTLGFNETETGKAALVATEMATNLVKHATGGQLLLDRIIENGIGGINILALDKGPGISNMSQCLSDGYSTSGSPGTGLGAISRMSAVFDIHSVPGMGTTLFARLGSKPRSRHQENHGIEVGGVCLPKPGETVSGDAWAVNQDQRKNRIILVVDGLGHGTGASEASQCAVELFHKNPELTPLEFIHAAHEALYSTRGAAMAVIEVDLIHKRLRFVGIGNISGALLSAQKISNMVSMHGIVGHTLDRVQEFFYPFGEQANGPIAPKIILHSDGLVSGWSLDRYPGLMNRHPCLIAAVLYRDFCRNTDDVTVVVVDLKNESSGLRVKN